MFNSLMKLAMEANQVIALRVMKLMRGGKRARREANLMVSEKIDAALKAGASLMRGGFERGNYSPISTSCRGKCHATGSAQKWPDC